MSFNKYFAKKIFENAGLKIPRYIIVKMIQSPKNCLGYI